MRNKLRSMVNISWNKTGIHCKNPNIKPCEAWNKPEEAKKWRAKLAKIEAVEE
jgi:hypothetical protein